MISPVSASKKASNGAARKSVLATSLVLHDDYWFLSDVIRAVKPVGDVVCFIGRKAWDGSDGPFERVVEIAKAEGAEVILGDWPDEATHRREALAEMKARGYKCILTLDGDEIPDAKLLDHLQRIAATDLADVVRVKMWTYWKDSVHRVSPPEEIAPVALVNCQTVTHLKIREYVGPRLLVLEPDYGVIHHLSYAGPDERIQRKTSSWSHRHELTQEWYRRSWKGWEADPLLRDLHPTHPHCYAAIERIEPVEALKDLPRWREEPDFAKPENWPSVSVVIPLHGGPEELLQCLNSLAKLQDLLHEVIVVDDASPDHAPEIVANYPFVTLLKNETNQGFAATCNKGAGHSTGEVVFFLNSDTIVPRAGLIRLIEGLMESGTIGAAGPVSNEVGYYQRINPTYQSIETMDLFAQDLALSEREDRDVEMLVGFALAVRRSVIDEIGPMDESFGRGLWEDNDYSFRILRAQYRLRVCGRAFVHHWGSRTLNRTMPDPAVLLHQNAEIFKAKWRADIESGYASHLPGLGQGLIRFNEDRKPEKVAKEIARLRDQADISLTMIVRNEERVLGACLESAKPFFKQIVVVDTGSTDKTIEIAKAHGAEVYESPWQDSFAQARNESLSHAKGKWICWIDADDTVPFATGEAILNAALSGVADAFVIPVQFLDNGAARGTSVDHVKLFKNLPGLKWSRRIHEQILSELTSRGINPARLDAKVLHTHYDASPEGQARKLERDRHLLKLEHEENPEDPFTNFNLGMTENHAGNFEAATGWLTKALRFATPQMTHTRKVYALLACGLRDRGLPEKALKILGQGLRYFPGDPELHFQAAVILKSQRRLQEAIDHLRSYGEDVSGHYSSLDTGLLTYKRWGLLGDTYAELGNYTEARKWYSVCLEREPWFSPAALGLFDSSLACGDLKTAAIALEAVKATTGLSTDWATRVCRHAHELGGPEAVVQRLAGLVEQHPTSEEPRLTLARVFLDLNRADLAKGHLMLLADAGSQIATSLLSGGAQ